MGNIIISLTSYAERINVVHLVIESLKKQTYQVDKIILWLDETELTRQQLPEQLAGLEDELFEVRFCPNYKSYKKLVPTLVDFPDANIITFDDDIIIPAGTVQAFVDAHNAQPTAIIASRGRVIKRGDKGAFSSYAEWPLLKNETTLWATFSIMPIGYGGVFYPVNSLHTDVVKFDVFSQIAQNADDIWFKAMAMLKGTETVLLARKYSDKYKLIENTQATALYLTTNVEDRNVDVFNAILHAYPTLSDIIESVDFMEIVADGHYLAQAINQPKLFDNAKEAADFYRDCALKMESVDLRLAMSLMQKARVYRPRGPMILKKIAQYKSQLVKS
ncbi:hypothetical protein [Shewanella saliphila]|uniref:Glycosyltransferase 2-like domain-containing protein n=1 Tax=Shewanella saliphila TaxID=2282698 RepID=A0ABQ2Q4J0_9GAMM|nr:hypothetical protein [Shewanella saliphila]MCL1101338.1 hypothetical protein [Shewanella saliphila]GGP50221.1 hypothetical protein GCM10009409_15880 [Shewanella saliphila]